MQMHQYQVYQYVNMSMIYLENCLHRQFLWPQEDFASINEVILPLWCLAHNIYIIDFSLRHFWSIAHSSVSFSWPLQVNSKLKSSGLNREFYQ